MFIPLPNKYVSERDDYQQPAKASEAWAWLWEQRIILKKKPSQREIASALCWSRHRVRELLTDFSTFCEHYFTKTKPKVEPLGAEFMGNIDESSAKKPPNTRQKTTTKPPQNDQSSSTEPVLTDTAKGDKRKNTCNLINKLLVKAGKGWDTSILTEDMVDVFNHWVGHRKKVRSFRKDQAKVLLAALKTHTSEDLKMVIDYCFTAPDNLPYVKSWRHNGYTDIINLLNRDKVDRNVDVALDWKEGNQPTRISALPPDLPQPTRRTRINLDL